MSEARTTLNRAMSEKAFQQAVIDLARCTGWLYYHPFDSRRSTPGYPDLTLVSPSQRRVIVAELKTERGKLSAAQSEWLQAFRVTPVETYEWRPSDWEQIVATLAGE